MKKNENKTTKFRVTLDTHSKMFQTFYLANGDVQLINRTGDANFGKIENIFTKGVPSIVHFNANPSKDPFISLSKKMFFFEKDFQLKLHGYCVEKSEVPKGNSIGSNLDKLCMENFEFVNFSKYCKPESVD